jgi:hypothetical protein
MPVKLSAHGDDPRAPRCARPFAKLLASHAALGGRICREAGVWDRVAAVYARVVVPAARRRSAVGMSRNCALAAKAIYGVRTVQEYIWSYRCASPPPSVDNEPSIRIVDAVTV